MNVLMFTNTFTPHVGGVARSVERFAERIRAAGHQVMIVAPEFEGQPENEPNVIRAPAIQNFNGSDFSVSLPIFFLDRLLEHGFKPDVIHSHHPYLLGDTAIRLSAKVDKHIVFTHHTMYEKYTHYVPGDSPAMKQFVIELSTGYANMCDRVIAPSESVEKILRERGVETEVEVIPTGVDVVRFQQGGRSRWRQQLSIREDAYVVGHLGRLAKEKNLPFLTRAVADFLTRNEDAHFLVVGSGDSEEEIRSIAEKAGVSRRVHLVGSLSGQDVVDAYHAMDVFAFASQTETQGMVLAEAMAAGLPVVAVDASGAREIVRDGRNGRLLAEEDEEEFARALQWTRDLTAEKRHSMKTSIQETAEEFSLENSTRKIIRLYEGLIASEHGVKTFEENKWEKFQRRVEKEYDLWSNRVAALTEAITSQQPGKEEKEEEGPA